MNAEDLKELNKTLYYGGFGDKFNERVEAQFRAGKKEFTEEDIVKINGEDVRFRLHFREDPDTGKGYFNSFDVALMNVLDTSGEVLEHHFSVKHRITAMEAYRMLKHGLLVAVNKDLYNKEGQQYNTWISIDVNGKKDKYGNFPVHTYHQNYYKKRPFDVGESLTQLPVLVKELESAQGRELIEKKLKKAQLCPVTILHNGEETNGTLVVNPEAGRTDVYDKNMEMIEYPEQQQRNHQQGQQAVPNGASPQEDLKKKTRPQQKVNWTPRNQQRKGQTF